MLTDQQVTQEQYESLIEDASYLENEAEALKYVIDEVPYSEVPSGGTSIIQKLALIDHAQHNYYRPLIEKAFSSARPLLIKNFDHYSETFEIPENEKDVQKILNKIIKHRAAILNLFNKIPLIDWERALSDSNGKTISLYDFANRMVTEERNELKDIAELVMIYQNTKQANREAATKARDRHKTGD